MTDAFTNDQVVQIIQAAASVASVMVAVVALVVAFRVEKRSQRLAQRQLDAVVKPVLLVRSQTYEKLKSTYFINVGAGPAIIRNVEFRKKAMTSDCLADLFDLGSAVKWDTAWRFSGDLSALKPGDRIELVKLSQESLVRQGLSPDNALSVLATWQRRKSGIEVRLRYEDVLGGGEQTLVETLK